VLLLVAALAAPLPAAAERDPSLVGAWQGRGGTFAGLVFSTERPRFFGDRVVSCVRAPCPPVRIAGTWKTRRGRLLLRPRGARPLIVRYHVADDLLTLLRVDDQSIVARLERATTYCSLARDCARQEYPRPRCIGADTCEATHTCAWRCGETTATCDGYRCVDGEHCEVRDGAPHCVAESAGCESVRCSSGRPHCVAVGDEVACLPRDRCHRDDECPGGSTCRPEFICVRAPCFAPLVCG